MCRKCIPSEDGYVLWNDSSDTGFVWVAKPSQTYIKYLADEYVGPIDLNIPYV